MNDAAIDKILQAAKAKTQAFELVTGGSQSTSIGWDKGKLKENVLTASTAAGLQAVIGGKLGFATTTNLGDAADLLANAEVLCQYGREFDYDFAPKATCERSEHYADEVEAVTPQRMFDLGALARSVVMERAPDALFGCDVGVGYGSSRIITSEGQDVTERHAGMSLAIGVERNTEGDFLQTYDVRSLPRALTEEDVREVAARALDDFEACKTSAKVSAGSYRVLLSPGVVKDVLASVSTNVNGLNVEKKISRWIDAIGTRVMGDQITIWDDPTIADGPVSTLYDGEGMVARKRAIIEKGALKGFVHSRSTAHHCGHEATGNAQRGVTSTPSPGFHGLVMEGGGHSLAELMQQASGGIFIRSLIGVFTSNFLAGQISGNIMTGWRVEGGERSGRIKNAALNFNAFEALTSRIVGISQEREWRGSSLLPYILLEGVAISA